MVARQTGVVALSLVVHTEIIAVLERPKFARALTSKSRRDIVELLSAAAYWVEPTQEVRDCRDRKDDKYLELALAAGASAILSGDEDLLVLDPWRGIPILRASAFLDHVARSSR